MRVNFQLHRGQFCTAAITVADATASGRLSSLIETARANGYNPQRYLMALRTELSRRAPGESASAGVGGSHQVAQEGLDGRRVPCPWTLGPVDPAAAGVHEDGGGQGHDLPTAEGQVLVQ